MTNNDMEPDDMKKSKYSGSALQQYIYDFFNKNIDLVKELLIHQKEIIFTNIARSGNIWFYGYRNR